ncbi:DegT/DnrJ/EryC1/StrS family aminotransferase [bacterium]|nr:DegT/DnrJ/EryC1/StrS family aminotransferase [bacterium]
MKVPLIDLQAQFLNLQPEIHQAIESVLASQKFILGEEGRSLESRIAELTQTSFAVGCASGTDALLLSLRAVGIGPGDEVITTAYSFFATGGMISWIGAVPVFVDIDPGTFNLLPEQVGKKITAKTKAILAVHLFGQCCSIEQLLPFNLPVIEDAAQAIGSMRNGKPAGSIGISGCFSFFPTKNLGAYGDGGMIVTSDETLAKKLKMLRAHGQESQRYYHSFIGTNSRLDELQAAVLRVKLKYLQQWNEKRAANAAYYNERLKDLPLEIPVIDAANTSNFHQYVIRSKNRDRLKNYLADQGIGTGIYYPLILPLQPCFSELGYKAGDFPNAEECSTTSLALPVYPELTAEQLEFVVHHIFHFLQ